MNQCLTCKFAEWKRTAKGRLHPDGSGKCKWRMPEIAIPKCRYFVGSRGFPQPFGGYIDRVKDSEDCPTYEAAS